MKIACTGGGTGGHTLPVLAVIKAIEKRLPSAKITYIGSRFGIESKLVPKMGIEYYGVSTGKFRRYHKSKALNLIDPSTLAQNAKDFFSFLKGIREARSILKHINPDVLFAKGGFVSLPVALAAKTLGIPIVAHESDIVMGLANAKISDFAERVCVSFPKENYKDKLAESRIKETGNPIRDDILMGNGEDLISEIGFKKDKKTLLVLGGSQGSRFINDLILEIIEKILYKWQLIWVTGDKEMDLVSYKIEDLDDKLQKNVKIYGFLTSRLADVYAASDLVISRAGSNVLFELAALAKPAILIPYDVSAGSHQLANATVFSRSGAAYLFRQNGLSSEKLFRQISYLFENQEELESMQRAMKKLSDLGAADKVAKEVIEVGEDRVEKNRQNKKN